MINFYHQFIPHGTQILQPLHSFRTRAHAKSELQWSEECISAFNSAKDALAQATLLFHPTPDATTSLMTDASDIAVGAVLQQSVDGHWQPISFSWSLSPTERKYSTFDRELMAVYLAIKHFRHFIEGRVFTVFTDHKPLTFSLHTRSDKHSPWQLRHLDFISQFTSDIRHIQGRLNPVADALSRVELNAVESSSPTIDSEAMALAQDNCEFLSVESPHHSLTLHSFSLPHSTNYIICDVSHGTPRPVVPPAFRKVVFDSLHGLSHPGIRATQKLVSARFVWPKMYSLIKKWARSCLPCQRSKVIRHTLSPLASFPTPDKRFDHIHVDIVGPLSPSHGQTYLLTCIDRFTRWPEAFPLSDVTAPSVARALISGWISRFGVPSTITTDRGGQFESDLWAQLMTMLGTTRIRTTSYYPQANGRWSVFTGNSREPLGPSWAHTPGLSPIPLVLLGIRTALKEDLHCTAAELVYGMSLRLPGEFFSSSSLPSIPDSMSQDSSSTWVHYVLLLLVTLCLVTHSLMTLFHLLHTFSSVVTQSRNHCSSHMMAHLESCLAQTSILLLTLMVNKIQ